MPRRSRLLPRMLVLITPAARSLRSSSEQCLHLQPCENCDQDHNRSRLGCFATCAPFTLHGLGGRADFKCTAHKPLRARASARNGSKRTEHCWEALARCSASKHRLSSEFREPIFHDGSFSSCRSHGAAVHASKRRAETDCICPDRRQPLWDHLANLASGCGCGRLCRITPPVCCTDPATAE